MFAALIYLQVCSIKNRTLQRFRRLKQPKYLAGGIVGGLYFYFYFFRYLFRGSGPHGPVPTFPAGNQGLFEAIAGSALLVAVVLVWLVPHRRAALTFSEAEVAFLFPAPITRRGLVRYKLLRSQLSILFTTLILMLVTNRFGGRFWIHAAGWWLLLSTMNLHLLGSSFARTMLLERGITNWQRRLAVLGVVLFAVAAVGLWAWHSVPAPDWSNWNASESADKWLARLSDYLKAVFTAGPLPYLLYPFRLVVRPYLAGSAGAFFLALVPALLVLGLHYLWVMQSDVAFEEASLEASRKLAEKVTAVRRGNWQAASQSSKARRPPFRLQPLGPPAVALFWKNLISAGNTFSWRVWLRLALVGLILGVAIRQGVKDQNLNSALGLIAGMLALWSVLFGPHIFRQDFRQDLPLADLLKSYPLRGWQLALGEVLGPAVILTAIQWFLLTLSGVLTSRSPWEPLGRLGTVAVVVGAGLLAPTLNLLTIQIPNAAVLLFPAWFQTGKDAPQGIEATGQRIIFLLGQILVFLVALIPAALAFGPVFFLMKWLAGLASAILLGCLAAALVLAAEAALGLWLLGRLFERLDLSAETTS